MYALRATLHIGASLAALLVAGTSYAQVGGASPGTAAPAGTMGTGEDPDAVSAGSTAPAAAGATEQYGDIVVTANKREQNLSDVGLSVTALGSQALANQRSAAVRGQAGSTSCRERVWPSV